MFVRRKPRSGGLYVSLACIELTQGITLLFDFEFDPSTANCTPHFLSVESA